jgi:hypothetical protein
MPQHPGPSSKASCSDASRLEQSDCIVDAGMTARSNTQPTGSNLIGEGREPAIIYERASRFAQIGAARTWM